FCFSPAEQRKAKNESDRRRDKTRVYLGGAFTLWRELRDLRGFKDDMQFAFFLLDLPRCGLTKYCR
uniref:Uncharacterized protein n=1 Tax=Scophthalmus maximus TaxID=52904 RepID=A0A8D3E2Z4_SCOMX